MKSVNFVMLYKIDLFIYLYMLCRKMFNVYINLIFLIFDIKMVII